jgi:murein DD-endopeptidase MepM/ murein hydrolase activator NlpD
MKPIMGWGFTQKRFNARRLLPAGLLLIWLVGCQLVQPVEQVGTAEPQEQDPIEEALPLFIEETAQAAAAPVRNVEAPLRFTLPTPGPAPISLWRPPLYDTPWALGPHDHFYFNRPIAADEVNWPLADYRYGGIFFGSDIIHTGVDIPAPRNTPVLAAANGRVISAGYGLFSNSNNEEDPYGLAVAIRHDFGYQGKRLYTIYAHMDQVNVISGQEVKTGEVLGLVGTTGFTTGPHLHFEVRMEQNSYFATFNPELWMAPPQGWGVLTGLILNTSGALLTEHDVTVRNIETRQRWVVRSYGAQTVNSDPYYRENVVLSDLPAGKYEIIIEYQNDRYVREIEIFPGAVSYFRFRGKLVFDTAYPPTPSVDELIGEKSP